MALRAESIPEPVRPIRVRACAWCEKDEMHVPLADCMGCEYNQQDDKTTWCSWEPAHQKLCDGCGIPAEYCEPNTCPIWQMQEKEKAAGNTETADDEYLIIIV